MKKQRDKFANIRFIAIVLIFLLILFSIGKTNSRYISGASSENDLIAKAILTLSNNKVVYTENESLFPGAVKSYEFSVLNYDDINTNEVLLSYYLEIKTDNANSPFTLSLQNLSTGENVPLNNGKTGNIDLPYGDKIETKYKLTFTWNSSKTDIQYSGLNLKYTVNLVALQKG